MFSAQAAANKRSGPKEAASGSKGAVTEDSVLRDIMAELKQEPVLLSNAKAQQKKGAGEQSYGPLMPFLTKQRKSTV